VVSGRITPTLPLVLPRLTFLGSDAPLVGGLLSLHAAVIPPLGLEPPALGLLLLLEPQAVRLRAAATPRVAIEAEVLRIRLRLPVRRYDGDAAVPVYVSCANISANQRRG
jgi:hypothetical protein